MTRAEAKAKGLDRYFTGLPCKNGHIAERHVRDGRCVECVSNSNTRYYQDNREQILVTHKKDYQDHREQKLVYKKQHYRDNREQILVDKKRYWRDNRERRLIQHADYYQATRKLLSGHPQAIGLQEAILARPSRAGVGQAESTSAESVGAGWAMDADSEEEWKGGRTLQMAFVGVCQWRHHHPSGHL
jgi:hypothetical protein